MCNDAKKLKVLIENLTGQTAVRETLVLEEAANALSDNQGLGGSQFNELLLLMGFDRITPAFFQYIANGEVEIENGSSIKSFEELQKGVERFQKLALLNYGNVKYGFKQFSESPSLLYGTVNRSRKINPAKRHKPILPIVTIPGRDTYYLGYIIEDELKKRLESNPDDEEAKQEEAKRLKIVEKGKKNLEAYLVSDHLDVYVATSMRERHEYLMVNETAKEIFSHEELKELKLRWFDPSQAYCRERIDKGLAEGLMLKRARCTLYFVQESDTMGKDSELAATLAQGKPVVAFVPEGDQDFVNRLLSNLKELYPKKNEIDLIFEQFQIFDSKAAWNDTTIQGWLKDKSSVKIDEAKDKLTTCINNHYNKRANTLKEIHPLGIQVSLNSGVANGVLVVRKVSDCAKLIRKILLNDLEFRVDIEVKEDKQYLKLVETVSDCVFRVMTGDVMLTNAFWNFYLK